MRTPDKEARKQLEVFTFEFESVTELVEWANDCENAHPKNAGVWDYLSSKYTTGSHVAWFGCENYQEVDRLTQLGWSEGRRRMEEGVDAIEMQRAISVKRRRKWGSMGTRISIQKVYSGQLNRAWSKLEKRAATGIRKVSIYVNLGALSWVSAEQLFWKGAIAVVMSDIMTKAGYSVRIVGYSQVGGLVTQRAYSHLDVRIVVPLKDYMQPLNKELIATCTGLAGFFRKYIFLTRCSVPYSVNRNMGHSRYDVEMRPEYDVDELVVNITNTHNTWDAESATAFIIETNTRLLTEMKFSV